MIAAVLWTALAGCTDSEVYSEANCPVGVTLSTSEGAPGTVITATGTPFSTANDTQVRVGGVAASVTVLERDGCAVCDECRISTCESCYACTDCDLSCASCVETLTFVVPVVSAGAQSVVITNAYGASEPVAFTVLSTDADTDSDLPDTDSGVPLDTDPPETDVPDTGATDTDTDAPDTDTDSSDTDAVDTDTSDTDLALGFSPYSECAVSRTTP